MKHDYKEEVLLAVPGIVIELSDDFDRQAVFGEYVTDENGAVTGIQCRMEYGERTRRFFDIKDEPAPFAELEIGVPYHFSDTGYKNGYHTSDYRHYILEKQENDEKDDR